MRRFVRWAASTRRRASITRSSSDPQGSPCGCGMSSVKRISKNGRRNFERLRVFTGAAFASVEEAVDFLEDLEAFVLIHFQAHGTTRIEWTVAGHSTGTSPRPLRSATKYLGPQIR